MDNGRMKTVSNERKGSTSSLGTGFRKYVAVLLAVIVAVCLVSSPGAGSRAKASSDAIGFGSNATGGDGPVYSVTTLNDSGIGSFRDAVSEAHRIVKFNVSGYIRLSSIVSVASNLTIDGQSAPNDGIGIMGHEVSFNGASNDIVQNIRFRQGDLDPDKGKSALNLGNAHDMIFDHISVEFGLWDSIDSVGAKNITVQNSIIADPIGQQFGAHTEAGPYTWYHDMFVNSHNRNPLAKSNTQFINNVVYNYQGGYTAGDSEGHFTHDVVGNYFITGPKTTNPSDAYFQMANQSVYNSGNYLDSNNNGTLDGQSLALGGGATALSAPWSPTTSSIPTSSAALAYSYVVANAGTQPCDQVDSLVIADVSSLGLKGNMWTTQVMTGLSNQGYGNL
jgi:hypothetical protein